MNLCKELTILQNAVTLSVRQWSWVYQHPCVEKKDHFLFIVPEELEAQSLPVSLSLSPSLVSATAEAEVLEQEALTTWCLRRRRPEHLERGLWSMAYSFAPSCNGHVIGRKQKQAQNHHIELIITNHLLQYLWLCTMILSFLFFLLCTIEVWP